MTPCPTATVERRTQAVITRSLGIMRTATSWLALTVGLVGLTACSLLDPREDDVTIFQPQFTGTATFRPPGRLEAEAAGLDRTFDIALTAGDFISIPQGFELRDVNLKTALVQQLPSSKQPAPPLPFRDHGRFAVTEQHPDVAKDEIPWNPSATPTYLIVWVEARLWTTSHPSLPTRRSRHFGVATVPYALESDARAAPMSPNVPIHFVEY